LQLAPGQRNTIDQVWPGGIGIMDTGAYSDLTGVGYVGVGR
jgi:hypothetical protein